MISELDGAVAKPMATRAQKRRGVRPDQETSALAQPAGPVIELVFSPRRLEAVLVSGTVTPEMLIELLKLLPDGYNEPRVPRRWGVVICWAHRDFIPPKAKPATRRIAFLS